MEIIIHLRNKKIDRDYDSALSEYIKRCSHFGKIIIKRYKKLCPPSLQNGSRRFIVSTDKNTIASTELADIINSSLLCGFSRLEFILPNGLDVEKISKENLSRLNFSAFEMDNELLSVALAEQIYRAYTILNNITYHK